MCIVRMGLCVYCQDGALYIVRNPGSVCIVRMGLCVYCQDGALCVLSGWGSVCIVRMGLCILSGTQALCVLSGWGSVCIVRMGLCVYCQDGALCVLSGWGSECIVRMGLCVYCQDLSQNLESHQQFTPHFVSSLYILSIHSTLPQITLTAPVHPKLSQLTPLTQFMLPRFIPHCLSSPYSV